MGFLLTESLKVLDGAASAGVDQHDTLLYLQDLALAQRSRGIAKVDLIVGSPPYACKGERYLAGNGKRLPTTEWVRWMLDVTVAALDVCRGYVFWVVNSPVVKGVYEPACEGLLWHVWQSLGATERPCIWHKNAPPNRKDYFGNNWEFVLAFKNPGSTPFFDWQAVAEPPKYKAGGRFRQRNSKGERRLGNEYPLLALARPRDVAATTRDEQDTEAARFEALFRATVGGGHMGSALSHDNEAPFPVAVPRRYVASCCPPAGIVCDPFAGSGTTFQAALELGRRCIGCDVRESQVDLTKRRICESAI